MLVHLPVATIMVLSGKEGVKSKRTRENSPRRRQNAYLFVMENLGKPGLWPRKALLASLEAQTFWPGQPIDRSTEYEELESQCGLRYKAGETLMQIFTSFPSPQMGWFWLRG